MIAESPEASTRMRGSTTSFGSLDDVLIETLSISSGGVVSMDCRKSTSKLEVNSVTDPGINGVSSMIFGDGLLASFFEFFFGVRSLRTLLFFFADGDRSVEAVESPDKDIDTDISSSNVPSVPSSESVEKLDTMEGFGNVVEEATIFCSRLKKSSCDSEWLGDK